MNAQIRVGPCHLAALLLVATSIAGCAPGSGEGLNVSGRPLSEGGDVPLAATLESIQVNVFDASCIVCHAGAAAPLGLRLDAASSFTSLVGVQSRQVRSLLLVEPGAPDRSYLVRKLEGSAAEGERMPLGGPPLPQSTIDFVRQWIIDGALPGPGGAPGGPPTVISLIPGPAEITSDFPVQITAGFDADIDAATVNAQTFLLARSGGDGLFGNGNDQAVVASSISLSPLNARLAVMDLSGVTAIDDSYRVTLKGNGPNVISDVSGAVLDGEFGGVFPSGDGNEGGDFVADFTVQGLQPSLDSIQANVFGVSCALAGCHTGPTGPALPQGMDLSSADSSFANLVGVTSIQNSALQRVAPNDAANSYLIRKIEGTAAAGNQMPPGGPPLDQATIDTIREWIDNGALR